MNHALGLPRGEAVKKTIALIETTFGERLLQGSFNTGNDLHWGHLPPHLRVRRFFGLCKCRAIGGFIFQAAGLVAGPAHLGQFAGIGKGCV